MMRFFTDWERKKLLAKREKLIMKSLADDQKLMQKILEQQQIVFVAEAKKVCLYFSAVLDDCIRQYVADIQDLAEDKRILNPDDAVSILGIENKGDKYVVLEIIDPAYNRHHSFFHKVQDWPAFDRVVIEYNYEYYLTCYLRIEAL